MSTKTYYAISQIMHDGKTYQRGDAIDLTPEAAKPLAQAKVISTSEVSDPAPAVVDVVTDAESAQDATVDAPDVDTDEDNNDGDDLDSKSGAELKAIAKDEGLSTSGNKSQLIERIRTAREEQGEDENLGDDL